MSTSGHLQFGAMRTKGEDKTDNGTQCIEFTLDKFLDWRAFWEIEASFYISLCIGVLQYLRSLTKFQENYNTFLISWGLSRMTMPILMNDRADNQFPRCEFPGRQ
jgi:hypothetical protein